LLAFGFGCIGGNSDASDYSSGYEADYSYALSASPSLFAESKTTYITQDGSIVLKVPEGTLETKYLEVKEQLETEGATFSNINYNEYSGRKEYALTMKILPSKFDSTLDMLKQEGEVKDVSVELEDVTEEYTDLETRITNKETELERLRSMYDQCTEVEDLLAVEYELSRVETEYELLQQQKQYLDSKIQMSTIYLTIYEDMPATQQLINPFEGLASLFFTSLAAAIAVIVAVAGFMIPIVLVVWVIWSLYKKLKGSKNLGQISKAR
jgi:ACT domain-containing protein